MTILSGLRARGRRLFGWCCRHKRPLFLLAAALVASFYGLQRCGSVDFVCTNGDYQNYNVLRRFLAGQVPYRDFANYLGMGPLLLCAPLLALQNSFSFSLFATHTVAAFLFILLAALVFYLVTGRSLASAAAALLLPKLVSSFFFYTFPGYDRYGYYITFYLSMLLTPGNSFRIARLFLPVLFCLIALLCIHTKHTAPPP